ncbi:hypothetical protein [Ferribacterium limneticum]|uniref:hypothetical protein n=1 Tax=Ferribacterium limneticum TaxID=76259 RepID=UPI001CF9A37B|nr:hypothetical protein [Ferribacterium limneticum]UCV27967.1 hypothetical protein KI617_17250 [Ferribacterium limneticum]UCV31884.1 hypothetical protein KI608_17250 [Ferribacterium limneticum]
MRPNKVRNKHYRPALTSGLWLSLPALAVTTAVRLLGIGRPEMYVLIVAAALSLPWSLFGGFIVWLALSALAQTINFDTFAGLYWGISGTAILGAHLNGFLLFSRRQSAQPPFATTVMQ